MSVTSRSLSSGRPLLNDVADCPLTVPARGQRGMVHTGLPTLSRVAHFKIAEAADLLGVNSDTVRRWVDAGALPVTRDGSTRRLIDGVALARFTRERAHAAQDRSGVQRSARNHLVGLVTSAVADRIMAQVEIQCGPHRVVSLMSSEAVQEMGLNPGVLAVAVIKSTNIVIETPNQPPATG